MKIVLVNLEGIKAYVEAKTGFSFVWVDFEPAVYDSFFHDGKNFYDERVVPRLYYLVPCTDLAVFESMVDNDLIILEEYDDAENHSILYDDEEGFKFLAYFFDSEIRDNLLEGGEWVEFNKVVEALENNPMGIDFGSIMPEDFQGHLKVLTSDK